MKWVSGLIAVGVIAALSLGLAECARRKESIVDPDPPGADRTHPQGHVYTLATEEPSSLNVLASGDAVAQRMVLRFTHDALMDRDPATGMLREGAAVNVRIQPDSVSFDLRQGLRFADGVPVTVDDVRYVYELVAGGYRWPGMPDPDLVRGFRTQGEAVQMSLASTVRIGVRVLARWPVVRASYYRERLAGLAVGTPEFAAAMARLEGSGPGSGPYRLLQWRKGDDLTLGRHEGSWHRAARPAAWNLAGIRLRFVSRPARRAMLDDGAIDFFRAAAPAELLRANPELASTYRELRYDHPQLGYYGIAWNTRRAAVALAEVRRALSASVRREDLVAEILGGNADPAESPFKERRGQAATGEAPTLSSVGITPDAPVRLQILVPAEESVYRRMVQFLASDWRLQGVEVDLVQLPFGALQKRLQEGAFDGAVLHFGRRNGAAAPELRFHSGQWPPSGQNFARLRDPELDRLLNRYSAAEVEERRSLMGPMEVLLRAHAPMTFLAFPKVSAVFSRAIRFEPGVLGLSPETFWVAPEDQRGR